MKIIHVIIAAVLVLSLAGCANDSESVVAQAAAQTITSRKTEQTAELVPNASVKAALTQIAKFSFGYWGNVQITGAVTTEEIKSLRDALKALPNGGVTVTLDFSGATLPGNTVPTDSLSNANNNLYNVILPNTVTKIEDWAFCGNRLYDITIPASVKEIGVCAFAWTSIKTPVIPDGVKTLNSTFEGCYKLRFVVIPASVTEFKDFYDANASGGPVTRGLFQNSSITDIYYLGTASQWDNIKKDPNWNNGVSPTVHYMTSTSVTVYDALSSDINDGYTVLSSTADYEKLYAINTVPGTKYEVQWCDDNSRYEASFSNTPSGLNDFKMVILGITENDDHATVTFKANASTTYIMCYSYDAGVSGKCAFRVSKSNNMQ